MSEWHVQVVRLNQITKHPGADALEVATVHEAYPCIVRLGSFKPGDLAVYIPIDSIVPLDDPRFAFLSDAEDKRTQRIKAKRLRGVFSMGLLIPAEPDMQEGDIVHERLRITKYDPEVAIKTGGEQEADVAGIPTYTDIEGYRKYGKHLVEGTEVVITEKLHGCLAYNTQVRMADGTTKKISQIVVGDEVMGFKDGLAIPTKVLNTFDNGKADKWLRIETTRRAAGKGNSYARIVCTPNHEFYVPASNEYKSADKLAVGDSVLVMRNDLSITPLQKQVLLGKMLGDGTLKSTRYTAAVSFGHKEEHLKYVEYTNQMLAGLSGIKDRRVSGYGTDMVRSSTEFSFFIKEAFESFIGVDGVKMVPDWVEHELSPIAMAFWYMDDGSLSHQQDQEDRANFATCAFSKSDCEVLLRGLKRFGISGTYYESSGYPRIRLNADEAERFFLLVAPYIPECMQYKLPERYRGAVPFVPKTELEYKKATIVQTITAIEDVTSTIKSNRFDIETETHNFFAPDVLVHNSNSRFCYTQGRLYCGSHHQLKKRDEANLWWRVAAKYDLETKLQATPDKVFFGEVYGPVQKGYTYDSDKAPAFRVFDVYDITTGRYMDWLDVVELCKVVGLDTVPVLYQGPWSESLTDLRNGKTTLGERHTREGFVVHPVREQYHVMLHRLILKYVGEDYLLKSAKE